MTTEEDEIVKTTNANGQNNGVFGVILTNKSRLFSVRIF